MLQPKSMKETASHFLTLLRLHCCSRTTGPYPKKEHSKFSISTIIIRLIGFLMQYLFFKVRVRIFFGQSNTIL